MDELTKLSAEAIQRYFTSLSQFGYKSYTDVYRLIVLLFIEEIMVHKFSDFITEKDYNDILKALNHLAGCSCLIDFPKYANYDELVHNNRLYLRTRATEENSLRFDDRDVIRIEV